MQIIDGTPVAAAVRMMRGTARGFDPWDLSGPSMVKTRTAIMGVLLGRKARQSESGVNALSAAIFSAAGVVGRCHAEKRDTWASACYRFLGLPDKV